MNVIANENCSYMDYFELENVFTFDKKNSEKFGIKYKHTPFSDKLLLEGGEQEFDAVFLGRAKERKDEILHIFEMLKKVGLKVKFMVLDIDIPDIKIDSYLDYSDYLKVVNKSRSIIEINKSDQVGCSLRFMESLFFNKKLITNNECIQEDPYYDYDNVFILGRDNLEKLNQFIKSPYCKEKKSFDALIFEKWISSF